MKQFYHFIVKEFYHIFRDRKTLFILLGMPMVQIIIFGFALTNEVKNTRIVIVNQSTSATAMKLVEKIESSAYFELYSQTKDPSIIDQLFKKGTVKVALIIPHDFAPALIAQNKGQLQIITDATDPNVATALTNYLSVIIQDFQKDLNPNNIIPYKMEVDTRMMYNPQLKGAYNFVPGVMAMVLLLVCTMMTALTVVKEKELGNMEILLTSPINPIKIILAKAVPYLLLSIINITTILLLSYFVLDVPINGSLVLLYAESALFIMVSLGLGLLISAGTDSQQSAMFISLIVMFLPTVMFSGFIFPIENMPLPLRIVSNIIPAKWFFIIVKSVMIKGVGIQLVWKETLILFMMMIFFFTMAIKKFKIRLA
ncbi:MAG: multidrug ABC transporter permease [Sphingobacteriia bacterium 28-36-52]|nr:MAG: multidrug ABC transporter permease [Sphingobacteriia bacterium 28-36-52]